jgi:hypothetical protein
MPISRVTPTCARAAFTDAGSNWTFLAEPSQLSCTKQLVSGFVSDVGPIGTDASLVPPVPSQTSRRSLSTITWIVAVGFDKPDQHTRLPVFSSSVLGAGSVLKRIFVKPKARSKASGAVVVTGTPTMVCCVMSVF